MIFSRLGLDLDENEIETEGLIVIGLTAWASLTMMFMIVRSWTANNWQWVAILTGLMCLSAGLGINTWRLFFFNKERGEKSAGGE